MPTWHSFGDWYADLEKMTRDLSGPEKRKITRAMAEEGARIAAAQARSDLGGDARFSGWTSPDKSARGLDSLKIRPGRENVHWLFPTRVSGGPWKVAEIGRNRSVSEFGGATGRGGGSLFQGPGVNRKTGVTSRSKSGKVIVRRSRATRWNGYTDGKHTATDALQAMEREIPKVAYVRVLAVQRKRFDVT